MANIGLPKIDIEFASRAASIIERSKKGIVLLVVKDDTDNTFEFEEYTRSDKIAEEKFTAENVGYIKQCFLGNPSKVIVVRMDVAGDFTELLPKIKTKNANWIGIATGSAEEHQELATWAIQISNDEKKDFMVLVYNAAITDSMYVHNLEAPMVKLKDGVEITGDKYIARLLGVFAGLPFTRSATFYELHDLEYVEEVEDIEASINAGKLVLMNDEGVVRIARAVNSLTTTGEGVSDEMKKITIVEAMILIKKDVRAVFKNDYVGKYKNKYDNQVLFISAINSYYDRLADEDILDGNGENIAMIDIEKQRAAWIEIGKSEAEEWDNLKVKLNTFRSNIFLTGKNKILDAIEDLDYGVEL